MYHYAPHHIPPPPPPPNTPSHSKHTKARTATVRVVVIMSSPLGPQAAVITASDFADKIQGQDGAAGCVVEVVARPLSDLSDSFAASKFHRTTHNIRMWMGGWKCWCVWWVCFGVGGWVVLVGVVGVSVCGVCGGPRRVCDASW